MEVTDFCGFLFSLLYLEVNVHSTVYLFKKKMKEFQTLDQFRLNSSKRVFEDAIKINTIIIS